MAEVATGSTTPVPSESMVLNGTELPLAIKAARYRLMHDMPYLAPAVTRMRFVRSSLVPTLAVDSSWRCYFNPKFFDGLTIEEQQAALQHEVSHLVRMHAERGGQANPSQDVIIAERTNLAGDLEINSHIPALQRYPFVYPGCEGFKFESGLTFEQYFKLLESWEQAARKQKKQQDDLMEDVWKEVERQLNEGQPNEGQPNEGQPNEGQGNEVSRKEGRPSAACGSGGGGSRGAWELPPDLDGVTPFERRALVRSIAEAIIDHVRKGRPGTVPAGWTRWAEELLEVRIPWQTWLKANLRNALGIASGKLDYSFRRRTRRPSGDVILPGLIRPHLNIGVLVDTSGSMRDLDLSLALGTIKDLIRSMGLEQGLHVMSCDVCVHTAQTVFTAKSVELRGGGGTNMAIGLEAMQKKWTKLHAIVVVTDGYTPWPAVPLRIPVFVVLLPQGSSDGIPSWMSWRKMDAG